MTPTVGSGLVRVQDHVYHPLEQAGAEVAGFGRCLRRTWGFLLIHPVWSPGHGITDPGQAIAPESHRGNPDHMRQAAIRGLEIGDQTEIVPGMTHAITAGQPLAAPAPPAQAKRQRLGVVVTVERAAWR